MIGIINAHMFGTPSEPGEHVNWSEPDYFTVEEFEEILETDPATFAEESPHMIVFEVES